MSHGYLLNRVIGEYHLVDFLGAGGMGEVYRGVHNKIGRVAAIKVMTQAVLSDDMTQRFFNEGRIQANLHHPNIATLYDFLEFDGQPCIVMEFIDGESLAERIQPYTPLPLAEIIYIFQAVVEAIAYIHRHNVIHRDIKSNNIKISSQGAVKLLDFGIAKAPMSPGLTAVGGIIGTLAYLSPEQVRGGAADARSDIWALGVLLYEMTAGRLPFQADTLGDLCDQIGKAVYAPPKQFDSSVPREIEAIIARCMKRNAAERYQTAQELQQDTARLSSLVTSPALTGIEPPGTRSEGEPGNQSWARRNWGLLAGAAAGVAVLALFLAVAAAYWATQPDAAGNETEGRAAAGLCLPVNAAANAGAPTADPQSRIIVIDTYAGQSEIYRDDQLIGKTRCNFQARVGERLNLTFKRDGVTYKPEGITVAANKKEYIYELKKEYIHTLK